MRRHFLNRFSDLRRSLCLSALRTRCFILFNKIVYVSPLPFWWLGYWLWLDLEFFQLYILVFLLFFLQHPFNLFGVQLFSWLCKLKENVLSKHTLTACISSSFKDLFLGRRRRISLNDLLNNGVQNCIDGRSEHCDGCHPLGGRDWKTLWNLGMWVGCINWVFEHNQCLLWLMMLILRTWCRNKFFMFRNLLVWELS